jgi:hypothetical protein
MKKDITLVAIDFKYHELTRQGLERSIAAVDPKEVVVISDKNILAGSTWIPAKPVTGMEEYAQLMLKWTWPLIDTEHALYVQWDGMATRPDLWDDEFLKYDYIGAPWPWQEEGRNVGNGGFSLRSRKLLRICGFDSAIQLTKQEPVAEDNIIGQHNRAYLEFKYGIKFAPTDVAKRFSFELGDYRESFGFHGLWNMPINLSQEDFDQVMPLIDFANWNVYKWNHFIVALANKGYNDHLQTAVEQLEQNSPTLIAPLNSVLKQYGFEINA